jgi:hypothetical protein
MVLLLLGALLGTARCQLQTPFNWMADGIDILRPFPAGLPVPTHPFNVTSFKAPPLPANAYRSVYVSVQASTCDGSVACGMQRSALRAVVAQP